METPACRLIWAAVIVGGLLFSAAAAVAAEQPGSQAAARAKLERLLACQQAEKEAALAEKRRIETHLKEVQAFRATLTDAPEHRPAVEKTEQALTKSRAASVKVEERLRLADLHIGLTLRAMKYLPTASPDASRSAAERTTADFAEWWAGRTLPPDAEFDKELEARHGFVADAASQQRIARIIERLHAASPDADPPVTVRILNRPDDNGASATRAFIYFDKGLLDKNPSDDELLFVAAHELAHVQLHHVSLGVVQANWLGFEEDWLRPSVEGSHPSYQDGSGHDDAGWRTRMAQYIRDQEAQADLVGAQQALAAGASPRGIKSAFTRLFFDDLKSRLAPDPSGQDPHYAGKLETHARPADRLKALEGALGEKFWERTDTASPVSCRSK